MRTIRDIDEDTITQAVIARHAQARDARLREVMTSLVQHLHAFARDVQLTEAEWDAGLRFLAEAGRLQRAPRRELAALSDALGLSTLVAAIGGPAARGGTEATLAERLEAGPAPWLEPGGDLSGGANGTPLFVHGQVRSTDGRPLAQATVEAWQAESGGAYDGSSPGLPRGRWRCDGDGRYAFRTVLPQPYPLVGEGPVARLLDALGREPWRPAHLHFAIEAPGHRSLATHVFRRHGPYVDDDAAFGVRRSLVVDWEAHPAGRAPDGSHCPQAFHTLEFDFVLEPRPA